MDCGSYGKDRIINIFSLKISEKYRGFLIIKEKRICKKTRKEITNLLEDKELHKEAWVAKILGTHLSIQIHKKVKFSWQVNSPLALKGLTV